jgi:hypothetical protein
MMTSSATTKKLTQEEEGEKLRWCTQVRRARSIREREERTLTLICGFVYHVINITYIHMRARGPDVYIVQEGEYTNNPLEKYNNRKAYYTSNSSVLCVVFSCCTFTYQSMYHWIMLKHCIN